MMGWRPLDGQAAASSIWRTVSLPRVARGLVRLARGTHVVFAGSQGTGNATRRVRQTLSPDTVPCTF